MRDVMALVKCLLLHPFIYQKRSIFTQSHHNGLAKWMVKLKNRNENVLIG